MAFSACRRALLISAVFMPVAYTSPFADVRTRKGSDLSTPVSPVPAAITPLTYWKGVQWDKESDNERDDVVQLLPEWPC